MVLQCEFFALRAESLLQTVTDRDRFNPNLDIVGVTARCSIDATV